MERTGSVSAPQELRGVLRPRVVPFTGEGTRSVSKTLSLRNCMGTVAPASSMTLGLVVSTGGALQTVKCSDWGDAHAQRLCI